VEFADLRQKDGVEAAKVRKTSGREVARGVGGGVG
jgi:hypothetical protein